MGYVIYSYGSLVWICFNWLMVIWNINKLIAFYTSFIASTALYWLDIPQVTQVVF